VRAVTSLRIGGASRGRYAQFNLGAHVGDEVSAVAANRARLLRLADLPAEPAWLRQVHGSRVLDLDAEVLDDEADAAVASRPGVVCAVLTADCLPVLLTDTAGSQVAAAHAGWRGLARGVLEAVVAAMGPSPGDLLAWLGPCIGPAGFEIGPEVRAALLSADAGATGAFAPGRGDRWHADLPALATRRLQQAGVGQVYRADLCTWSDSARFFSHRRDGLCGRMATLIWRDPSAAAC
jgi:YfiH family protein